MRRKRSDETFVADERQNKAVKRGGDGRFSTRYVPAVEGGKARHGHVDRLSYNYARRLTGPSRTGLSCGTRQP